MSDNQKSWVTELIETDDGTGDAIFLPLTLVFVYRSSY